jgi:hypothetical protein
LITDPARSAGIRDEPFEAGGDAGRALDEQISELAAYPLDDAATLAAPLRDVIFWYADRGRLTAAVGGHGFKTEPDAVRRCAGTPAALQGSHDGFGFGVYTGVRSLRRSATVRIAVLRLGAGSNSTRIGLALQASWALLGRYFSSSS